MTEGAGDPLVHKIRTGVNEKGRCMLTQPAEVAHFRAMTEQQLHEFTEQHGWTVVWHLGGDQIEFFKIGPGDHR